MATFQRPKRAKKTKASQSPRVAVVFGQPLAGTSSAIRCLMDASKTKTALVHGLDEAEIREHLRSGVEVVFVDDFEPTAASVQFLNDTNLVSPMNGKLVQIWSAPEDIMARGRIAKRAEITPEYLLEYRASIEEMEERVNILRTPYHVIYNGMDLSATVANLAEVAGIVE